MSGLGQRDAIASLNWSMLLSAVTMLWQCHGQLSKAVAPVGLIRS
jgi:hypothetical protein